MLEFTTKGGCPQECPPSVQAYFIVIRTLAELAEKSITTLLGSILRKPPSFAKQSLYLFHNKKKWENCGNQESFK